MTDQSILILGVGNYLLSDEGIGVHIAQKLMRMELPPEVEVIDGGTLGFELIPFFRNKKKIIIIDCIDADEPPGTIIWTTPNEIHPRWSSSFSVHQNGLSELLQQCSLLEPCCEVWLLGIVPASTDPHIGLSADLGSKVDLMIHHIMEKLAAWHPWGKIYS